MVPSLDSIDAIQAGAVAAYPALVRTIEALDDDAMRGASLLPGWTRAHVATHIARNADSHVRLLEGARSGTSPEQYPGGLPAREEAIQTGARRPAADIGADVKSASAQLFEAWAAFPPELWTRNVRMNSGDLPAWRSAWSRWREIAIHHVDLVAGFGPADWQPQFLEMLWPSLLEGLPARLLDAEAAISLRGPDGTDVQVGAGIVHRVDAPLATVVAWLLGRAAAAPDLPPGLPQLAAWA